MDKKAAVFSEAEMQLIETAADTAATKALVGAGGTVDYCGAMERLLYSYKHLEALVRDEKEYLTIEHHSKSKSVTVFCASGGGTYKAEDELIEEVARIRLLNYEISNAKFQRVDRIVDMFRDDKRFIVIRMHYFNEDADGNEREQGSKKYTWEEIGFELSERGILSDAGTARRWSKKLVQDMAVDMFGVEGALSAEKKRGKTVR